MNTTRNILANSFSLSMIADMVWEDKGDNFAGLPISVKAVRPESIPSDIYSVVGHADTARVIGNIIGREVPVNREIYKVSPGDILYVAQYIGPGLLGGDTQLPKGAVMKFYKVTSAEGALGECQWEVTF